MATAALVVIWTPRGLRLREAGVVEGTVQGRAVGTGAGVTVAAARAGAPEVAGVVQGSVEVSCRSVDPGVVAVVRKG